MVKLITKTAILPLLMLLIMAWTIRVKCNNSDILITLDRDKCNSPANVESSDSELTVPEGEEEVERNKKGDEPDSI